MSPNRRGWIAAALASLCRCAYYIDDIHFEDDPRLTPAQKRQLNAGRGGPGLATPRREGDGWVVTRDIVLGAGIPGYPVAAPK